MKPDFNSFVVLIQDSLLIRGTVTITVKLRNVNHEMPYGIINQVEPKLFMLLLIIEHLK